MVLCPKMRKMTKALSEWTFGDSKAAINIAKIMNGYVEARDIRGMQASKKTSRILSAFSQTLHQLKHIPGYLVRGKAMRFYFKSEFVPRLQEVEEMGYPKLVSHAKAIMMMWLRQLASVSLIEFPLSDGVAELAFDKKGKISGVYLKVGKHEEAE